MNESRPICMSHGTHTDGCSWQAYWRDEWVPCERVVLHMNESRPICISHGTHTIQDGYRQHTAETTQRGTSHMNESCPMCMSHGTHTDGYRQHTAEVTHQTGWRHDTLRWCLIWMSQVPYEWVMSHMYESRHPYRWMQSAHCRGDTPNRMKTRYTTVVSRMNESRPIWMSHVPYECVTADGCRQHTVETRH